MKNKSWKTTIIGLALAIVMAVQPLLVAMSTGVIEWRQLGVAALIAIFGYVSKDSNVTGGTKDNGLEPKE